MIFKWKKKNNLDEFQEQKLLYIEKDSFWTLYFLLAAAFIVQLAAGCEPMDVLGEWVCFMIASLIIVVRCIKNGIWDRRMKPDRRTNFLMSVIAGTVVFLVTWMIFVRVHGFSMKKSLTGSGIAAAATLVVTYVVMSIMGRVYKKRLKHLEEKED